ncbi:hypothetical protein RHGRI_007012 [Rhododendron griersonianum]|uniref:GDSL esterase/lipase n=1 Tax=Rhododendron griersonianum TaxID=479676 RepID=A0AAV6KVI5_9ERIC|nr:hypothetical protein RHGRI_007012 [Rhododendron griersonianum]
MEKQNVIFFFSSCFFLFHLLSGIQGVQGSHGINGFHPKKLIVFGDSYFDTGNDNKSTFSSWKVPYGITFPGKPTGRSLL